MLRFITFIIVLAAPISTHADEMAFYVKNTLARDVAVEFVSRTTPSRWPGGDKVFLVEKGANKSIPVECQAGENICYGAWAVGDDSISFGAGPDHDRKCEECCFLCAGKSTETIELAQ